jgi:hypothetical protein
VLPLPFSVVVRVTVELEGPSLAWDFEESSMLNSPLSWLSQGGDRGHSRSSAGAVAPSNLGGLRLRDVGRRRGLASCYAAALGGRSSVPSWLAGVGHNNIVQAEQREGRELEGVMHLGGDLSDSNEASFESESGRVGWRRPGMIEG